PLARPDGSAGWQAVGLDQRGSRHVVALRNDVDGLALRHDDRGAAFPAPRARRTRWLARRRRAGDLRRNRCCRLIGRLIARHAHAAATARVACIGRGRYGTAYWSAHTGWRRQWRLLDAARRRHRGRARVCAHGFGLWCGPGRIAIVVVAIVAEALGAA